MFRRVPFGRLGLLLFLLVLLPALALLVWRKEAATWALSEALRGQGMEVSSLEVTELGWEHASVRHLAAAAPGVDLKLRTIDLDYSLAALLAGIRPDVSLSGLNLELDPDSPWLQGRLAEGGGEASAPAGPSGQEGDLPRVPDIDIEDATVRLATPVGFLQLGLEGALWQDPTAALIGAFSLTAMAEQGETTAVVGLTLTPERSLLADIVIEEGDLDIGGLAVRGLSGSLAGAFDGQANRFEHLESDIAVASISGDLSPESSLTPVRFAFATRLEDEDLVFSADLSDVGESDEGFLAKLAGRIALGDESTSLTAESRLETAASLPLFARLAVPLPATGYLSARAEASVVLPPLAKLTAMSHPVTPESALGEIESFEATFALKADKLSHPDYVADLAVEAAGRAALAEGDLELHLTAPLKAQVTAVSSQLLAPFDPNEDLTDWVESPLELSLVSQESEPFLRASRSDLTTGPYRVAGSVNLAGEHLDLASAFGGELSLSQGVWSLGGPLDVDLRALPLRSLSGVAGRADIGLVGRFSSTAAKSGFMGDVSLSARSLSKDDLRLRDLTADLPLSLQLSEEMLRIESLDPGRIAVSSLTAAAGKTTSPLVLQVPSAEIGFDFATQALRPRVKAVLQPSSFALGSAQESLLLEMAPLKLTIAPQEVEAGKLSLLAETTSAMLPDLQIAAADIELQAVLDPAAESLTGRLDGLKLEDLAESRRFEELLLEAAFRRNKAGRIDFTGAGSSFGEALSFTFEGRSDPGEALSVDVTLPQHDFAAKPLKVRDLSWLSDADVVRGILSGSIHLTLSPEGPEGHAMIEADGLAGKALGFPFESLSLTAGLNKLWPPQASTPIRIDLASFNPGLPLRDLHLEAVLPEAAPFTLDLRDAAMTVLGTQLSLKNGRLGLLEGTADLPIRITGLDLAEILEQAELADVEVSGRLTGDLPISFDEGAVTVRPSRLAATEPGVLRVRSEEISSLLTGYGDEVNSMVRALEDFHYEDLSLSLEKTAEDDLMLLLSILGQNPAVLDGQPFRINLNLESNIGQILDTIGEGLELSKDLLSGRYSLQ